MTMDTTPQEPADVAPGQIKLSLADLGVLAATARRNGTRDAFVDLAMQWAAKAHAEIERQAAEIAALRKAVEFADYMLRRRGSLRRPRRR
jgi:hypothetical protein